MYKNKITRSLFVGAGLSLALVGCGEQAEPKQAAQPAAAPEATTETAEPKLAAVQELVRGNGTEVATIDPHKTQGVPESHVIRDILEGLVNQDADGNLLPGAAESWETSDNQTYTFHLRKDAQWSNGDPVTAEDFVYSFQRLVDPNTASPYSWYMEYTKMKNAKAIIAGEADKSTLGVKALDDHTLVVELDSPVPYFVMMMGHQSTAPVHKATVEKYGDQWTKPEHFVGNGAYVLDEWVVNERLTLKRNEKYWDNADTIINKVTFLPIENQVSEMNRFLSGEIHITNELPLEHYKRLTKEHPESVSVVGNLCTYYYLFNTKKAPFDDVRVRKAISYTIDRNVVANAIMGQGQKPAYFLTPEITAGFDPEMPAYGKMTQEERNAEAQRLLAEAGYGADNPLDFSLLYNTSENHKKVAVALGSMWKKTLGVDVTLENQEWKTYLSTKDSGDFQIARAGWCGDYNEASSFLTLMKSGNTTGGIHYDSKAYDEIMEKAITSKSEEERKALYAEAEKLMANDMPLAPIYQYVKSRLLSPKVGGFPSNNPEEKIYSKDLYIIE
ncbi:ABC transporter substrate-binding protein [Vibrio panuliri]|uniref:Oligopeptide ABC transporter substrate-binding protein OppA n=1 Tax=Vibrio panuliri TaxID=1381081 RepID=A0A1Q9HK83_9VIBR|nr:ABC transporter substrate-binding protein [Vibrio panuliri]KAB1454041.1 oligopeptide ABC transporter substrate-binding protein OppA [Vibrio panuliri]OLQ84480.1 oligopeptide ABC transporter substrate-binding protein OppA [Vibrio panuliri]OLQ90727.1 oligopeptide ABC transporter substrate-binding protein OppA [Vibrio panuliri]